MTSRHLDVFYFRCSTISDKALQSTARAHTVAAARSISFCVLLLYAVRIQETIKLVNMVSFVVFLAYVYTVHNISIY